MRNYSITVSSKGKMIGFYTRPEGEITVFLKDGISGQLFRPGGEIRFILLRSLKVRNFNWRLAPTSRICERTALTAKILRAPRTKNGGGTARKCKGREV